MSFMDFAEGLISFSDVDSRWVFAEGLKLLSGVDSRWVFLRLTSSLSSSSSIILSFLFSSVSPNKARQIVPSNGEIKKKDNKNHPNWLRPRLLAIVGILHINTIQVTIPRNPQYISIKTKYFVHPTTWDENTTNKKSGSSPTYCRASPNAQMHLDK